jgi:putative oxidoreductase
MIRSKELGKTDGKSNGYTSKPFAHGRACDDLERFSSSCGPCVSRLAFSGLSYGKFTGIAGTTAYFTSLGMSPPELWAWFAAIAEVVLGAALILGIATRYAALASFVWVLVATAIAHRYWTYPAAQQAGQYNNWLKNIAIMGGTLYVFVAGAGRYSVDAMLAKR